jgi:hypothetical protein
MVALLPAMGVVASAQSSSGRRWEVEVHGGGIVSTNPGGGTVALPGRGAPLTGPILIVNGVPAVSRAVSSWYFGDGAALLNEAQASIRLVGTRITPLDAVLQSPFVERGSGSSVGFRVGRMLTPRFVAEFSFDYHRATPSVTSASTSGIEATRASFTNVWASLLPPPARNALTVSSVSTVSEPRSREVTTAGLLLINVLTSGRIRPYAALGAGVIATNGTQPSVTIVGDYDFTLLLVSPPGVTVPNPRWHETDTVTVRSSVDTARAWIVGGGVKLDMTERWGIRFDLRDTLSSNTSSTLVSATPAILSAPTGFLLIGTTPPIIFGGTFAGVPSSLSGPPLSGFKTFDGNGVVHRVNITAGLCWRF